MLPETVVSQRTARLPQLEVDSFGRIEKKFIKKLQKNSKIEKLLKKNNMAVELCTMHVCSFARFVAEAFRAAIFFLLAIIVGLDIAHEQQVSV